MTDQVVENQGSRAVPQNSPDVAGLAAELQHTRYVLETCRRVLAFDLRKLVTFGPDFNQAAKDALDAVTNTLKRPFPDAASASKREEQTDRLLRVLERWDAAEARADRAELATRDERLNYAGALSDLDSCLEVLIRRINGEADLASAAEWVRLNYPRHAAKLNPAAPKGEGGR